MIKSKIHKHKSGSTIKDRLYYYSIPEPNTGCWLWTGSSRNSKQDYGSINIGNKVYYSHIISYYEFKGNIENGFEVCHKCDTPSCINPDHLFLGTHKENMQDCINKNRNKFMIKKEFCKRGHKIIENKNGRRRCYDCEKIYRRR